MLSLLQLCISVIKMKHIQRVPLFTTASFELFKIKMLHKTSQIIDYHPNVQIRVGTGRLHCVERSLLSSDVNSLGTWAKICCCNVHDETERREDSLTSWHADRKKSHSVPKIKTKYILIILTCQAPCKNYSSWFEIPCNFILHFVLSMIVT